MAQRSISWLDPAGLDDAQRDELWRFAARYEDVTREDFLATLDTQDTLVVCRHAHSGTVGGLISWRTVTAPNDNGIVLWGEMGMLDREFRGRFLTERAFLTGILRTRLRHPFTPLYIMAEAATQSGYLMLARIFGSVWPRPGHSIPPSQRRLVEFVVDQLGDTEWDGTRGVFHRGKPMNGERRRVPARLEPLAEFYARANPGQGEGDSLMCVIPVPWRSLPLIPVRSLAAMVG